MTMKKETLRTTLLFAAILIGVTLGVLYVLRNASDEDVSVNTAPETTAAQDSTVENPNKEIEEANMAEVPGERPIETDPAKQPVATITDAPLIYTGYGHSSEKPLPTGQATSTSCTTDSGIECTITFTNADTGEVVTFDPRTTDQEGIAIWSWTGGQDLTSGEWRVVVSAGNKSSTEETIYVQ